MKTIYLKAAAAAAVAIAAPASAQFTNQTYQDRSGTFRPGDNGGYQNNDGQDGFGANGNISARIEQLRARIDAGVRSGAISPAEARPLRQQLRALAQAERQYSVNGLTGQERADLQQRLRGLRQQVRTADGGAQNGDGQYGQYGNDQYGNGQNANDQYGSGRIDRDNDGFDDRDYDRDGRWDDDARNGANRGTGNDAQNGGYEDDEYQQPVQRGGLGGLIDNVLGRGVAGGLRVGQRASGNLYALPSEYRNQYRDGSGSYYRTDGRQIYQIDARNQTVVRVHAMR